MKNRYAIFFILIIFNIQLVSFKIEKQFKKNLKISIIIPCHPQHAIHLYPLVKLYKQQTVIPYEVVVSLSESKKIKKLH